MKEDLIELIKNSSLSDEEKNEWESMIMALSHRVVSDMYEFLSQYPQEITWFNDFYKRKQEAFKVLEKNESKGKDMLSHICMEETDKLLTLVS
jgi:hypothetical protein